MTIANIANIRARKIMIRRHKSGPHLHSPSEQQNLRPQQSKDEYLFC
jgi:hypothetical protein